MAISEALPLEAGPLIAPVLLGFNYEANKFYNSANFTAS